MSLFDQAFASLQNSGRIALTADTTFYVRNTGTAAAPVANTNTDAGAMATWNTLYNAVTSTYDFAGFTVTLMSGTQNTYPAGLFMSKSWVGGGQLIIDLNGCSIAETVTKGIINDVVQPGQITIQNGAGLGVGGVVSSAGFAGIQNDQPSDMNIGVGITMGDCFDAAFEATQNGAIYLGAPVNIGGTNASARSLALAALGGIIGFNAQQVNFLSNKTYTIATMNAPQGGNIIADGIPFNLNAHTITGPRYFKDPTSFIWTANAISTYIPGSSSGVSTGYDNTTVSAFIYGGAAPGSTLTISSTSNASPSGDSTSVVGSNVFIGQGSGTSNIFLGNAGFSGAAVSYAGATSGVTILKASAVASGTLTMPAATGTLIAEATAAWQTYTPTITSGSGAFTTVSATGRYKQYGKTIHLQVDIVITTAGTAASSLIATLPVNSFASTGYTGVGRERAATGASCIGYITTSDAAHINIIPMAGGTIIASGNSVTASLTYEAA